MPLAALCALLPPFFPARARVSLSSLPLALLDLLLLHLLNVLRLRGLPALARAALKAL